MLINVTDSLQMTVEEITDILEEKSLLQPDGCWEWTGSKTGNGYPQYYVGGPRDGARYINARHLAVAVALERPVSPGLDAFATCLRRNCVNPDHFEERTRGEIRAAIRAAKDTAPAHSRSEVEATVRTHIKLFQELLEVLYNADIQGIDDITLFKIQTKAGSL